VEVLVAMTLLGLASSTLLLATVATVQSGHDALSQTIARGIAEQVIDDVLGQPYYEPGGNPFSYPLGAEAGETANPPATFLFDDADDFHEYVSVPPRDPFGIELGSGNGVGGQRAEHLQLPEGYLSNWRVEVAITYVDEVDLSVDLTPPTTSGLRAVRVRVSRTWDGVDRELVMLRQVFSYVPPVQP
jgi:hypothetical protein